VRLVVVICRTSLERDVVRVIESAGVAAFSIVPAVLGIGASGKALDEYPWPGSNTLLLVALEETRARVLNEALRAFKGSAEARQHGAHVPLRAFSVPCDEVI
jgi:hypothetical protein